MRLKVNFAISTNSRNFALLFVIKNLTFLFANFFCNS